MHEPRTVGGHVTSMEGNRGMSDADVYVIVSQSSSVKTTPPYRVCVSSTKRKKRRHGRGISVGLNPKGQRGDRLSPLDMSIT